MTSGTLVQGRVGPQKYGDGAEGTVRMSQDGALFVEQLRGKYSEAALRGEVFTAMNVAAQAVSVALATTYTGLVLCNPLGSGKNFLLLGANYALSVAPVGIAPLVLLGGYNAAADVTHTTPLAAPGIRPAKLNASGSAGGSVARVDSAATISTPWYLMPMGSGFTAGALYGTTPSWIDLGGAIVIPPGGFVAWGALTAVTGFGGLMWQEVPEG